MTRENNANPSGPADTMDQTDQPAQPQLDFELYQQFCDLIRM